MIVKWHNVLSGSRDLPGGSPQGASLGIWSFLSQTNDNPEDSNSDEIYKFVDDKSVIEVVNLFSIGMASHNLKSSVPSNIPVSNIFIPSENLKTQANIDRVDKWTDDKQMKLNIKKTKNLVINFSKNHQFSTEIKLKGEVVETVNQAKLLGTIITNDLTWNKNTEFIVKETNKRMRLLHRASKFTSSISDLKQIYMLQIRSKLDQSAVVWHSSLTKKNSQDLERIQKSALKCILGKGYVTYKDALNKLQLQSLGERREAMCLKFAKQCLKIEKMKELFPRKVRHHDMAKRNSEVFDFVKPKTSRYQLSAIPVMQRMLDKAELKQRQIFRKLNSKCTSGL